MSHVVTVELRAKPDRVEDLARLMDRHAQASRAEEGCLAFDVCQDPADPATFVVYEVYRDQAAHQAHRETEHFRRFSTTAPELVEAQADGGLFVSRRVLRRR